MRRIVASSVAATTIAVLGLAAVAPASAAGPSVGNQGIPALVTIDGKAVHVASGTTLDMICWRDELGRMFFVKFTSGEYDGKYGDIRSGYVVNQVSVPHCD